MSKLPNLAFTSHPSGFSSSERPLLVWLPFFVVQPSAFPVHACFHSSWLKLATACPTSPAMLENSSGITNNLKISFPFCAEDAYYGGLEIAGLPRRDATMKLSDKITSILQRKSSEISSVTPTESVYDAIEIIGQQGYRRRSSCHSPRPSWSA